MDTKNLSSTSFVGLSSAQAAAIRAKVGPNKLPKARKTALSIALNQFASPLTYLLFFAAILSLFLGEYTGFYMISIFIFLNAALGFHQEYYAEKTFALLQQYLVSTIDTLRDGTWQHVATEALVPGDLIRVEPGDLLPADVVWRQTHNLAINQSVLTGEAEAAEKEASTQEALGDYQDIHSGFASSTVVHGSGIGLIVGTGINSSLGKLTQETLGNYHETSFARHVRDLSLFLLYLTFLTLGLTVVLHLILHPQGTAFGDLILFAITVAVAVVPEALPVVITFSLARGARSLAAQHVLVKRLSAIEEIGNIEILCCDKTGTLTENTLKVAAIFPHQNSDPQAILRYGALCAPDSIRLSQGSHSFDQALFEALTPAEQKQVAAMNRHAEYPFDPERRRSTMVYDSPEGRLVVSKGSLEAILAVSPNTAIDPALRAWQQTQESLGNRSLAVAYALCTPDAEGPYEQDLTFAGLVAFTDPIKATVRLTLNKAKALGVEIKIITGDSATVAQAVSAQVGLISTPDELIEGAGWAQISPQEHAAIVATKKVFARFDPRQKFEVMEDLCAQKTVGFLGEGINDAPAIKQADVGIAVSNATDVARESADIIILDKQLSVVINGIKEGRRVSVNTMKYLLTTLAANMSNFYSMIIASLVLNKLPMLPIQILLVNLLSDLPMIMISADTVTDQELAHPQRYNFKVLLSKIFLFSVACSIFDFLFISIYANAPIGVLQTNWFIFNVYTELIYFFSLRTPDWFFRSAFPNPGLVALFVLAAVLTTMIPYLPIAQKYCSFVAPDASAFGYILLITLISFVALELLKCVSRKMNFFSLEKP